MKERKKEGIRDSNLQPRPVTR
ncbi:hypothetical protein H206_03843, partial [Candidatus Electrothrix aarhusensis]